MTHIDFRDQISKNKRKSFFLMSMIFIITIVLSFAISFAFDPYYFTFIMIIATIFSLGYILITYNNSHKIAIASVNGKIVKKEQYPLYWNTVEALTIASGLPMPKLYVMESSQINAFTSGKDPKNAVICVTTGCLQKLNHRELEGVLAHELGHVANYDMRYMTLVTVMVGMISIISQIFLRSLFFGGGNTSGDNNKAQIIFMLIGILLAIIAPIVVTLVQLSISRKREYTADATAVKFTRYPTGLINALKKIKTDSAPENKKVSKAIAPLFFSSPFKNALSTHPPLEERIKVLERM